MFFAAWARVVALNGMPGTAGGAGLEPSPQPGAVPWGPPVRAPSSGSALSDWSHGLVRTSYGKVLSVIVVGASGSFWWSISW